MTGMCVDGTPVEDHREQFGLWVKREDLCCPGGPNFSKTRGVWAHVAARPEKMIGVLDTAHSQGGWAVARACAELGKQCVEFYPVRKADTKFGGEVQEMCLKLGAFTKGLPAGRSAVLYHTAKKILAHDQPAGFTYMMPNALKLPEMITETAAEVARTIGPGGGLVQVQPTPYFQGTQLEVPRYDLVDTVLISASSGTIAAGVCRGLLDLGWRGTVVVHQGYSRPEGAMRKYMAQMMGEAYASFNLVVVDEGYAYAGAARPGPTPPWPCNQFYDLKAFRWWMREGRAKYEEAMLWNIG